MFLGAGVPVYGPITPANRKWFANLPPVPHDPARAKRELAAIGLTDRNGDGLLEDANNQPVRFSLLAQKGNTSIERGAAVIRDELKKIGVTVDVVALDGELGDPALSVRAVRCGVLPRHHHRHRSRHQPRFLAQLGQRARVEPRTEDARDRVGSAHRRIDAAADGVARRGRAQAAVRRGADDLRRAPADDSVRRARGSTWRRRRGSRTSRRPRSRGRSCCGRRTRSRWYIRRVSRSVAESCRSSRSHRRVSDCLRIHQLATLSTRAYRRDSHDAHLPGAASRLRAGAGVHRVVGVAAADAMGARRLRDRDARARRGTPAHRGDARAVRARSAGARAVPGLARRRAPARLRPVAGLRPSRDRSDSRARRQHGVARDHGARWSRRSIGLPLGVVTGSRRGGLLVGSRAHRVGRAPVDAAAADVALPGLRRRAHRMAADRRDGHGASPRSFPRPRWACRLPRCSSGCRRRRCTR